MTDRNTANATKVNAQEHLKLDMRGECQFEILHKDPKYHYIGAKMRDSDNPDGASRDMQLAQALGYTEATGKERWRFGGNDEAQGDGKKKILHGNRIMMRVPLETAMRRRVARAHRYDRTGKDVPTAEVEARETADAINRKLRSEQPDGKAQGDIVEPLKD